jgi:polyisoprenoid-binding protein YceI
MRTKKRKSYTIVASLAVLALAAAAFGWFATQPPPVTQSSTNEAEVDTPAPAEIEEGSTLFTVASEGSEARYRVREQLAQRDLPNDAVGATNNVAGSIVVDQNGAVVPEQSRIPVDMASLESDSARRDNYVRQNTLETQEYPTAEFVVREAPGLPNPLPTSGEAQFQVVGDLTIHGVTRPTTWNATAQFDKQGATVNATTRVAPTDFGMTPPRVGPVLSIEDEAGLELDLRLERKAATGEAQRNA